MHRSTLKPIGFASRELGTKPVIGILTTWSDINPCNLNLRYLANEVRKGVLEAGGTAFELPLLSLSENLIKPTSFLYRNLLAMDAEECIRAYPLDAVVLLGGCDKTVPALMMGACSANVPFIVVTSGPSMPRSSSQGDVGTGTAVWRLVDSLRSGNVSLSDFAAADEEIMTSPGHCSEMGTASSVATVCEAMGVALSGSAMVSAADGRRALFARQSGRRAVELAAAGTLTPPVLLDQRAFDNAVVALCAVGGSTNVLIHLLAIAGRVGVPLNLDRIDILARRTPVVADVQPSGRLLTNRLFQAGGIPAVLRQVRSLLHLDALTVEGCTLGAVLERAVIGDTSVVHSMQEPVRAAPAIVILRGNIAPYGAVLKTCAGDPSLFRHIGPAIVFESVQELASTIDDPALGITPDSVLVLRGVGPVGAAMPEWGMLPIPKYLLQRGVKDMVRISDARMSGTGYGTAILHVSPEAAVGGPLALVKSGDSIRLDVERGQLELMVADDELSRRREAWKAPARSRSRGYQSLYAQHVLQANEGCDFDFLRGYETDVLPDGLFEGWVGGW